MNVKLRLVNRSHDVNNSDIVIFQRNVIEPVRDTAIAWRVIRNLGFQSYHPFVYPLGVRLGVKDAWGNFTPDCPAEPGQRWEMIRQVSGNALLLGSAPAQSPDEIELLNKLPQGAVSARVYRDSRLLAEWITVSPGQKARFEFLPRIFIGIVSQIREGDVMDSAVLSDIGTEINLHGISSADILMTGGGSGGDATPIQFSLANIELLA